MWAYQKRPKSQIKENVLLKAQPETCLHLNGLDISVHKQNSPYDCKAVPKMCTFNMCMYVNILTSLKELVICG